MATCLIKHVASPDDRGMIRLDQMPQNQAIYQTDKLFTNGIPQGIRARWIDSLQIVGEPKYTLDASTSSEFKSRVSLCHTLLIQMKWMGEDDMQMFGISDLYNQCEW